MARQQKVSLDYFPMDCVNDDAMKLIEAKFGTEGFAVVTKIYQRIYGTNGYFCDWNEDVKLLFASEIKKDYEFIEKITDEAVRRKVFDKEIYEKHSVLTSRKIQLTYFEATIRRNRIDVNRDYILLYEDEIPQNVCMDGVNVNIKEDNVSIYSKKEHKSTQSKVKKIKEEEIKENKKKEKKTTLKERESIVSSRAHEKPSFEEIVEYAIKNRYTTVDTHKFYEFFIEKGRNYANWRYIFDECASGREGGFTLK